MKTLGIIGGIGPESTVEYYRAIIAAYRERHDGNYPSIIINSISVKRVLDLVSANKLEELTELLCDEIERLARAGADFAIMASNTPHIVFDQLLRRSSIPLVSIVKATAESAKASGFNKVGLFGTRFTMQAPFYPEVFAQKGMAVVLPHAQEQDFIHEKYVGELLNNIIRPETRNGLLGIIKRMKEEEGIQGLIMGGTDLFLALRDSGDTGVALLDTAQIHAIAAAQMLD